MFEVTKETVKGFGINAWNYRTDNEVVNKFIDDWEGVADGDPLGWLEDAIQVLDLRDEAYFNNDALYLYFDKDFLQSGKYNGVQMQKIIRATYIRALWLVYKEKHRSIYANENHFVKKCERAMPLSDFGHRLNEHFLYMM